MVQNLYKNWLQISKIIGIWITSDKQWKVQKVEIQWATFVQTLHSFSYIQKIYLTLLVWNVTKFLTSFLKSEVIFHDTSRLYCFSSNITYFWQNISSKCKFSGFSLLKLKFIKFLMSFFKEKVSFSLKFGSLFSVTRDNSAVLF